MTTEAWAQLTGAAHRRWQATLERAFALSVRGDHAGALHLASEAAAVQVTPALRLFLAEEHEALARAPGSAAHLLEAEAMARACMEEARAQPALRNRERVLQDCTTLRDRVSSQLAHLELRVPSPPPEGLLVHVGNQTLSASAWNTTIALLPGEITLDATAPGRAPFRRTLHLVAGASESIDVELPLPLPSPPPPPPPPPSPPPPPPPPPPMVFWTPLRVTGAALLGLGVVSGIASMVFYLRASSLADASASAQGEWGGGWQRYQDAINYDRRLSVERVCERARTDPRPMALPARSLCDEHSLASAMYLGFGVAALSLTAVGTLLVALPTPARRVAASLRVSPWWGAGVSGASFSLRF